MIWFVEGKKAAETAITDTGLLTVAETETATALVVRAVSASGKYGKTTVTAPPSYIVSTIAGSGASGSDNGSGTSAQFNLSFGVAVHSDGTIYVADEHNHRIRKITSGAVISLAGSDTIGSDNGSGTLAQFNYPSDVAVDSGGTVYVADALNNRIRKITPEGVVSTIAGGSAEDVDGTTSAQFNGPCGVAVDSAGIVYVADFFNNRIRKITKVVP